MPPRLWRSRQARYRLPPARADEPNPRSAVAPLAWRVSAQPRAASVRSFPFGPPRSPAAAPQRRQTPRALAWDCCAAVGRDAGDGWPAVKQRGASSAATDDEWQRHGALISAARCSSLNRRLLQRAGRTLPRTRHPETHGRHPGRKDHRKEKASSSRLHCAVAWRSKRSRSARPCTSVGWVGARAAAW